MSSLTLTPVTPGTLTLSPQGTSVPTDPFWDAKGDLAVGSGPDTASRLAVGSNNQVLVADSAQTLGVKWASVPGGGYVAVDTLWDAKGDLAVGSGADTAGRLGVGSNNQVLTADSAQTLGVKWATPAGGFTSPLTTKGDVHTYSSVDARLAVGSDGQVLTADSAQTTGIKWAAAAGGGAWTLLYNLVLGSAGTFDQASISGSYNDLMLCALLRGSAASSTVGARIRFNNDSGSNYAYEEQVAFGASDSASEAQSQTEMNFGTCAGSSATAGFFGMYEAVIAGYASTTWQKLIRIHASNATSVSASGGVFEREIVGLWASTAAVNRIQVFPSSGTNFVTGSVLRIYGRT